MAESPFVPNTPISSSAVNSDFSDIATNGLTNAVAKDGQTTITGAFKGAAGTAAAPMYAFAADPDSGMYRIAANNVGIAVGGAKILDIASTGLTVTGSFYPTSTFVAPAGTVTLPSYTFSGDLDTGIYEIGANNIGVAVNATKILDIGAAGLNVIGTVSSNGVAFSPTAQAAGMVNGTIVESHAGNAVTFTIKTLAGNDPSASDPVFFTFRNTTPATGNYAVLQVTAALSLTVSSGSTLGTASSNVAFKLWLVAFNDASTVRLGVINTVLGGAAPTSIYPLGQFPVASSTAEGGTGTADSAQIFYTGAAVTSKAYSVLGYAAYETGQTTAGSWAASPTRLQLFGNGVPLPGVVVQPLSDTTTTVGSITNTAFTALSSGQTKSITPTSASNLVRVFSQGTISNSTSVTAFLQLARGSSLIGNPSAYNVGLSGALIPISLLALDAPNTTSSTTYGFQGKSSSGTISYPIGSTGSYLELTEIMT